MGTTGERQLLDQAIAFAVRAHAGQTRKGKTTPYIVHPIGAMRFALEYRYPLSFATAAVLHDVVEDTTVTAAEIASRFGADIGAIVAALTKTPGMTKLQWARCYLPGAPWAVQVVKACDALDNLRELAQDLATEGERTFERFHGGRAAVETYYVALAAALDANVSLFTDFAHAVELVFDPRPWPATPLIQVPA